MRIFKANEFLRELYRSVVTKRELSNTANLPAFKTVSCFNPHLWSWILGNDWRNTIPSTSGRDGINAKV